MDRTDATERTNDTNESNKHSGEVIKNRTALQYLRIN